MLCLLIGNWLGGVRGGRRKRQFHLGGTVLLIFAGTFGILLAVLLWEKMRLPNLSGNIPEPLSDELFQISSDQRRKRNYRVVVEIKDEYPEKKGAILSVILDPKGNKVPGGIRIPQSLIPADLQKGQLYVCEMAADWNGFLVVKKIEKF